MTGRKRGLTDKQQAFIDEYLQCFNATKAAKLAGYSEKTAYSIGQENLNKPEIIKAIRSRIELQTMKADEALLRLSLQARATMEDFLDEDRATIDLAKADRAAKLHLIKKFTHHKGKESEHISIELYDAQAALIQILKEMRLDAGEPTERHEIVGNLSESERIDRITTIFDRARTRRTGRPATDD